MKILSTAILIIVFCAAGYAQQSVPQPDAEITRVQLVNALERAQTEVKASRKLIDALNDQVEVKEARIKALNQKDELATAAIANLQSEIKNLRAAITEATAALKVQSDEVATLKKDLDKTRKKLKRARSLTKYVTVAAAALAGILIIKR